MTIVIDEAQDSMPDETPSTTSALQFNVGAVSTIPMSFV